MDYFLYISETKVSMLSSQSKSFKKGLWGKLKLNFGLISTEFSQDKENLSIYEQALLIEQTLGNKGKVGTPHEPKSYFSGEMPLKYGVISDYISGLSFFGEKFDGGTVVLIGSPQSMVGGELKIDADKEGLRSFAYYTMKFLNYSLESDEVLKDKPLENFDEAFALSTDTAIDSIKLPSKNMKFLAKTIYNGTKNGKPFVVGTPIYVSLAE
ncbi:DUF7019 family protein [Pseudoalteromonas fuliginea]|uniref:Uncharacterized protein n=1 Tax=Pseudoalteromonas fuliginea TaxID=1872678 RepID=A0ABQ6RGL9_9GAMM|nr:SAVMC3_10250 family protein [Pseudoalteromonas fuliginea]KAA1154198.1 hypothetical protein EU509_13875 [Pseudoalteromonas fuliginea]KAA1166816.1 hypothetical protein EUZ79_13865 [Pseudoalteromonas fuliginea]